MRIKIESPNGELTLKIHSCKDCPFAGYSNEFFLTHDIKVCLLFKKIRPNDNLIIEDAKRAELYKYLAGTKTLFSVDHCPLNGKYFESKEHRN